MKFYNKMNIKIYMFIACVVLLLTLLVTLANDIIEVDTVFAYDSDVMMTDSGNSISPQSVIVGSNTILTDNMRKRLINAKFIDNHNYFEMNPLHARNSTSDNKMGTCTTVAMQLLLGYHNYYSDRRLLPRYSNISHSALISSNFGDLNYHPDNMEFLNSPNKYSDEVGYEQIGTKHSVYDEIFGLTTWGDNKNFGQNLLFVTNATRKFIYNNAPEIMNNVSIGFRGFSSQEAHSEIDADKPLIVGFNNIQINGEPSYHVVVAYGYAELDGVPGYIVHYGWDSGQPYWVPESWLGFEVTMTVNHKHSYVLEEDVYRCNQCGHFVSEEHLYKRHIKEDSSVCIDGLRSFYSDSIQLPSVLSNKNVSEIGYAAFANQKKIKEVTLPDSIKAIGPNAFENCTAMTKIHISETSNLNSIGNAAFYNCIGLKTITYPVAVKTIGHNAFERCSNLEIAESYFQANSELEIIGNSAFAECSKLGKFELAPQLTTIGANAFMNCVKLGEIYDCKYSVEYVLENIGNSAFAGCENLYRFNIHPTVKTIGAHAFLNCTRFTFNLQIGSNLEHIGNSAFAGCTLIPDAWLPLSLKSIGERAFDGCTSLVTVTILQNCNTVGANAFANCSQANIYTGKQSRPSGWHSNWNSANRPVLWGCGFEGNTSKFVTVTKTANNPTAHIELTGFKAIILYNNYMFNGWYTSPDFSGENYFDINEAPNGKLYAKWIVPDSCVAEGSLITLADGTQKAVEDLTGDEQLLVWNMFTGTFDTAPILFIDSESRQEYEVIKLSFSDGTTVKVISEHAFWDFDLNKYVFLRADAARYIGHWFNKQTVNADGEKEWSKVQLVDVELTREITAAYSPVTYGHLCYYVNGMLSMPGATEGLINIFDVDGDTMKIDEAAFNKDIEKYGLFTYEEFAELLPISEEVFDAFGGQYLKVAIGKGLTDMDKLAELIARYAKFFNNL